MVWSTDMVTMLRHMINDLSATPSYSDARLQQLILVAATLVRVDMSLTDTYTIDLTGLSITPDPMEDEDYSNLILLKSACMLSETDMRENACKFLKVKDDKSFIDNTKAADIYKSIYEGEHGPCALYKQSLLDYQINQISNIGRAIMTPIRTQLYPRVLYNDRETINGY